VVTAAAADTTDRLWQGELVSIPSDRAASLVEAARTINASHSLDETLQAIVEAARVSVPGMDHAGISTVDRDRKVHTRAATDAIVNTLDDLQYSLMEGPCVDALRKESVVAVPDIRNEQRWPRYVAGAVASTGLTAQLAVQLYVDDDGSLGSLNLYATGRAGIDPDAADVAQLFAAHATTALDRAQKVSQLTTALQSRSIIGQAMGILMERYQINDQRAFAFLTRASSHGNIKLRDVAQEIVEQANAR
jgi:GAF domain-containing protein